METRTRGIVLTSAEVLAEGRDVVLDNICRTGATAISPTLGIQVESRPGEGSREPPLDVDGQVRLLDRSLWGKRELWLKSYVVHPPDPEIWREVAYPPPPLAPSELRVDVTRQVIDGARERGLRVDLQISPYTLPGAPGGQSVGSGHGMGSVSDRPVRIDGGTAERIVSGHGCLNNPRVRALGRARLREALRHYGDVDQIFLDWAEYTCYFLEDCFTCFCEHCERAAREASYDWERIRRDTRALWDRLHRLNRQDVSRVQDAADWPFLLADGLIASPGVADLLRFKAETVRLALADLRATMDAASATSVGLGVNGFAPPWSRITGMDYREVSKVASEIRCKLFTFHWPMITRWWSEALLSWNSNLEPAEVLRAVTGALDLPAPSNDHRRTLEDYGMPRPDEPHPITPEALIRKQNQAIAAAGSGTHCSAYVHSYRPIDEFARHLEAARASKASGCWIQRYGYLSDEKLAVLREVWTK